MNKNKSYILVYNDDIGSLEEVRDFIDKESEIETWRVDLPNTFYLISSLSANDLAQIFHKLSKRQGRFIISEISTNKQGWLPERTWKFINST